MSNIGMSCLRTYVMVVPVQCMYLYMWCTCEHTRYTIYMRDRYRARVIFTCIIHACMRVIFTYMRVIFTQIVHAYMRAMLRTWA